MAKPITAIIGVGESAMGRVPGVGPLELMLQATDRALESAGLELSAIDGLITVPVMTERWYNAAVVVSRGLGIDPRYVTTLDLAGASGAAMVEQAGRAIDAGLCEAVLCVAGQPLLSGLSRDMAVAAMAQSAGHPLAEAPSGPPVPALYALFAARHMHEFGTTREQLAAVAVQMRRHAALNENAHFRTPITVADVLAAKPIATPFTMLDCAPVSDGACAMVVISAERARRIKPRAAYVHGAGYGMAHAYLTDADDLMHTGARKSGRAAFAAAGMRPSDMEFCSLYDCFTITLLLELEELGLCPRGEAGRFVQDGHIDRDGSLPTNTGGGLLSGGHPGLPAGLFPVAEAARQIMGEAGARQLKRADLAVAHGNGGVVAIHCTLVLGSKNV
jgi:acetyl-CoA acetyltransferase